MSDIKILFIGDMNEGTRSLMRARALEEFADIKCYSNSQVPFIAGIHKPSIFSRVMNKLGFPMDEVGLNYSLLEELNSCSNYNLIWIDKSPAIRPNTLNRIKERFPEAKLISVSEDDMYASHNRNYYYDKSLNYFDVVFTTKVYNLVELKRLGAKRTILFLDSFDKKLHRPLDDFVDINKKVYDVSFTGTFEDERAKTILWLGSQGIKVHVFGNGWRQLKGVNPMIIVADKAVYGEEYVEIINKTKINLGFLRKINRDQVTSRTMEIIGSGAFLLAERTERHRKLFKEGDEADFFSSNEELLRKIKYYLVNKELILNIARSGRVRAIKSGYDMNTQMLNIVNSAYNQELNES